MELPSKSHSNTLKLPSPHLPETHFSENCLRLCAGGTANMFTNETDKDDVLKSCHQWVSTAVDCYAEGGVVSGGTKGGSLSTIILAILITLLYVIVI